MKYELTTNSTTAGLHTLYQVRALKSFSGVNTGDLGGWVESLQNLSQDGDAWVFGDARVFGTARVSGDAQVFGIAQVFGTARVYGDAQVSGGAQVFGIAQVFGTARVYGGAQVSGDAKVLVGAHSKSPLYIQGTRHSITVNTKDLICVGCKELSLAQWQELFLQVGTEEKYSEKEIKEYKRYLDLISEMLKETK